MEKVRGDACAHFARVCRLVGIGLLALVSVAQVQADEAQGQPDTQNTLKGLSLEQLSEIEVTTPNREPQEAFRTPSAIYVITNEEILRSGATSIPEALRLAPGVEVARIDSDKWSIGIRGFGSRLSRSVLVLIDGRTVYTTLFDGTYWEVQNVMLEDVDRIEVIRGPGGTIWGPNAVNGVINIITKKAKDTRGALVSAGGGNTDQGFGNVRYGGSDGANLNYRAYGQWFTRGPEYHSDGRNFDDWRAVQGGFRGDWDRDPNDTFSLQGDIYDEIAGESVVATSYAKPYQQVIDGNAFLSGGNVMLRWWRNQGEGKNFELQTYYDRTNRKEPNLEDIRDTYDLDFTQHWRFFRRNAVTWGLGARFAHADDPIIVSGLQFLPIQRTDRLLSAFLQDEIGLISNRLSLTIGSKFLNTNFTSFAPEPSARLLWTPGKRTSFWAAATHAVRTPSDAEENFYLLGLVGITKTGEPFFARFNPNPNFHAEEMNGYELGFRQLITKSVYLDVTSFYNHYNNLFSEDIIGAPYSEPIPAPPHLLLPADFGNGLMGNTKGFEIAPEWRPSKIWRLHGSYSYLHMNLERAPHSLDVGTAPGIMGSSPGHQVMAQSLLDMSKSLQFDADFRYVSSLPGQMVPSYSTADGRFAWQVSREFALSVVGRNLLQPYHYEYGSDPSASGTVQLVGIKRSAYVELTWTSTRQ